MYDNYIGERIKILRQEFFQNATQLEFAHQINTYLSHKNFQIEKHFQQNMISSLEKKGKLSRERLSILLNFLKEEANINPSWVILENNSKISKKLEENNEKFMRDKRISDLKKNLNEIISIIDEI